MKEKSPVAKDLSEESLSKKRKLCIKISKENTEIIKKHIKENREEIDEDLRNEGKTEEEIKAYWQRFLFKRQVMLADCLKEEIKKQKEKNREKARTENCDEEAESSSSSQFRNKP